MTKVNIKVTNELRSITSANRLVAGLSIPQTGDGITVDVSDDQLAELAADRYVQVRDENGEVIEAPQGEEAEPKLADPLDGLSRKELNTKAKTLGIEKPEKIEGGVEAVRRAIRDKQRATPDDGTAQDVDINTMDDAALKTYAAELGIEKPEDFANLDNLRDAVAEKRAEQGSTSDQPQA